MPNDVTQARMTLMRRLMKKEGGVSQLARELDINRATLWRFLWQNYEPRDPAIREALGIGVNDEPDTDHPDAIS